jgi:ubiquinone/menaquinone biosynthesis C-methylase UbiE
MGLKWTGERLTTDLDSAFGTFEHLHRYAFSREVCRGKKVLDIASGEGYGSNLLSEVAEYVWGVDISSDAVAHAKEKYARPNLEFHIGSATSIPIKDGSVDVVVSFETIEHIVEHDSFLSEIKRVLKKGGMLIISTPDKSIYSERDPENPYHVKELATDEFRELTSRHFRFSILFQQRFFIGSVISGLQNDPGRFSFFDGSFSFIKNDLSHEEFFNKPFFNLILASDREIESSMAVNVSLFSAYKTYDRDRSELINKISWYEKKIRDIEDSFTYKLYSFINKNIFRFCLHYIGKGLKR